MKKIKIKLSSDDARLLESVVRQIVAIAKAALCNTLIIPHKTHNSINIRLISINATQKLIEQLKRLNISKSVIIEIKA